MTYEYFAMSGGSPSTRRPHWAQLRKVLSRRLSSAYSKFADDKGLTAFSVPMSPNPNNTDGLATAPV